MRKIASVLVVVVALAGLASAEQVRVNYNYATTGIGTGAGLWSVTIDSGLLPGGVNDEGDPIFLDPNTPVTFMAPMATPVFTQHDTLFDGDVVPNIPGLAGWANDPNNNGEGQGMSWVFYGPNDVVTLRAVTRRYVGYTLDVQTRLAGFPQTQPEDSGYHYSFNFADSVNEDGLDFINAKAKPVSWWGDVAEAGPTGLGDGVGGHRHSGNNFQNDNALGEGQDYAREGRQGFLDGDANGDGIGVSLGFRDIDGPDTKENMGASLFFYNVVIGGDVFSDTMDIYMDDVITAETP